MIFITETNSIYEIDYKNNLIRRLSGSKPATERQGDNQWKKFESLSEVEINKPVLIIWPNTVKTLVPNTIPTTLTSNVVEITDIYNI